MVIYFHGAPGAPVEGAVFDPYGKDYGLSFICLDRFSVDSSLTGAAYYQRLAKEISNMADGKPVDFIGFSIGAFVALQTCRYMNNGVRSLHLISAAAPLDAGNFHEQMAGKQVFKLAGKFPFLFLLLSYWQGLLVSLCPNALFRLLFASATGEDMVLAARHDFQTNITSALRSCFLGNIHGYIRDVTAYVQPWKSTLSEISVQTHIWHGSDDNWSPKAMAEYLESAIHDSKLSELANLSHYSCLYASAPEICIQLTHEGTTIK